MMELKFNKTYGPGSDETSAYDVVLDYECTLQEFFIHVLLKRTTEWGDISLSNPPCSIEYSHGNLTRDNNTFKSKLAHKIDKIRASGGWSQMSYYITLKD